MTTSMPTERAAAGFDSLITEARTAALSGWNFSFLAGRTTSEILPWSTITRAEEEFPRTRYLDIGAIVLQLRAVPWQVPGFDIDRHRQRLQAIHNKIIQHGAFTVTSHRLLLEATRN
jgi:hypothetical protein